MKLLQIVLLGAAVTAVLSATLPSLGDDGPPSRESVCDELHGAAFGLCTAFCEAQDCDVEPKPSCDELRRNFERVTGMSVFPCEQATPTSTATLALLTPTNTPQLTPTDTPRLTPTNTPPRSATTSATATATAFSATATATATAFSMTATATATALSATATETAVASATQTGVPTGTATATATGQSTPTDTPAGTQTATATPPAAGALGGHCMCDCEQDGEVTIEDLVRGVLIALGSLPMSDCPSFAIHGHQDVSIADLIGGVHDALDGCD